MKDSLLRRNIGLLVGVVLAGQLLAGMLVLALVLRPQTVRVADISARMLDAVSVALDDAEPGTRAEIVERINRGGGISLRPASDPPDAEGRAFPNFLERMFMRALAERLAKERLVWRTTSNGQLWMLLDLGGEPYWANISPPRMAGPLFSLLLASLIAFIVAVAGGLVLQRRLNRPLRALERGVASFEPGSAPPRIEPDGPREIAAVAQAFNEMAERIEAHDSERALMLAGVSHDLRTPLARLRLSIEMMPHDDEELRASAHRQIEQIDRMLGQFLDFSREEAEEARVPVALDTLLHDAAEDAGMAGEVAIEAEPGLQAVLHPLAMRRAIRNLLENAARYGVPPIALHARAIPEGAAIEVLDRGAGFDPALAGHFLKPFVRADNARGSDGTGLGLAIANRIVADEGGQLRFERGERGFAAVITLPAGEAHK